MTTWDILTTSIPHRHEKLLTLLETLDPQMRPGIGLLLYRDDLEVPYGEKTRALIEASTADYVCSLDDDDSVAPDYVDKIADALEEHEPDYVGFRVRWTQNGEPRRPVIHSLACGGWHDHLHELQRDIAQFNPLRREYAMPEAWAGGWEAERRWSDAVRASGKVQREVYIDEELHYYQENLHDNFRSGRSPMGVMPELPSYPWLKQIGPYA